MLTCETLCVHVLFAVLCCRVLEGHIYDTSLRKEDALVIARRGVQEVEGGYRFTRDLRLKEVGALNGWDSTFFEGRRIIIITTSLRDNFCTCSVGQCFCLFTLQISMSERIPCLHPIQTDFK